MVSLELKHNFWCLGNFIFLIFYLFFVFQGLILLINEKETIDKDNAIKVAAPWIIIIDFVCVFVFLIKVLIVTKLKLDEESVANVNEKILVLEWITIVPNHINFFSIILQIGYLTSNNFTLKEDFFMLDGFIEYYYLKIGFGWIFMIGLMLLNMCFFCHNIFNVCCAKKGCCKIYLNPYNNKIYAY